MKKLLLILFLILALPAFAYPFNAFLKESDNAAGTGDKMLKESDGVGDAIAKEHEYIAIMPGGMFGIFGISVDDLSNKIVQ